MSYAKCALTELKSSAAYAGRAVETVNPVEIPNMMACTIIVPRLFQPWVFVAEFA